MYEVVNKQDGSRVSRPGGKMSTTLFDEVSSAKAWMASKYLSPDVYEVRPAKESQ